ncbi:ubiquinol-cytochrome c reductase iron-sulfur subunit [Eoetvoesiella caeni]|uniref:Ubiquinol-cytochrome c reductase iron-sulfur subunit n=1 Tax=Eoetvoesiella caeni TaxID=645616 RepID=A0A366H214_9BURK|nr:ubiquinol-cytochrome c reductase iron-sulfur subunit [Eoetvoesiella caeni]MCI2808284.1 ubiquinol-cytochrome c reductase iron-sulfur subunit [Eoetvoesiella caeni]NYT53714.1 ubiquinol-cytochrome c reductase iron-sulfur subunit [Eoetvoesiella caeni]RBP35951.1 ubiquinol-cytochrome c reductase iron-sulfur subunit [Eoetvoesiella caeni]
MSQDNSTIDGAVAVDPNQPPDPSRRFWVGTACAVGGVAGVATAVPFVGSFAPSAKARAAGAPVEVDLSTIPAGEMRTVEWRGKPVWVLHRTPKQLEDIKKDDALVADPNSDRPGYTPPYAKNEYRSRKPEHLVVVGICTHLGCSPTPHLAAVDGPGLPSPWEGGFLCPCHGSIFDLAGRVYKNKPAPDNLEVPPYQYSADGTHITIGVDEDNKA